MVLFMNGRRHSLFHAPVLDNTKYTVYLHIQIDRLVEFKRQKTGYICQ